MPFRALFSHFSRQAVFLCGCLIFAGAFSPLRAQTDPTPEVAATATSQTIRPGSSDSGELENRLLFRVRETLRASSPPKTDANNGMAGDGDALGVPGGQHWIILMQVSRYRDSNVRLTNMRRGVQRFLTALAQSRQGWPREAVQDTVSVLPYHFSLLGQARGRVQPLADFLDDASISKLRESVPGLPQDDKYQGQTWRDGHDWRASMQETLRWMRANDLDARRAIIIVLDWNDLAQAPLTLADGTKPMIPATDQDLVLPTNPAKFKAFSDAMLGAGLDPKKNLETVQVGNLEYDLAVFAPKNLEPIPVQTEIATPTPTPEIGTGGGNNGGNGAWILLPFLGILGAAAVFVAKPIILRLDEQESRQISALPPKTLPLLGTKTEASGAHFRVSGVSLDTDRPLALIQTDFSKKILVTNGALSAQNSEGFESTPHGLRLRGQRGEFDLVDSATGRVLASVSIRRL